MGSRLSVGFYKKLMSQVVCSLYTGCKIRNKQVNIKHLFIKQFTRLQVTTPWGHHQDDLYSILKEVYVLTYLLTYSMEQSPSWEANWFSASQEIPRILWNQKVHYSIHNSPPPVPILSQVGPVRTLLFHILKIHLNIIFPTMPGSPKWSLSHTFPHQNPVYASPLPHTRYMSHPSPSSRFYHPNSIGWGVQIIKLIIMYFSPLPDSSSFLGPNILFNTLFSNTLSLLSSINVSDQISHPYKIKGEIIVPYILFY